MSSSLAAVCVASSKSQKAAILSAVIHVCRRGKEADTDEERESRDYLTCMKYRFTSLKGRLINWSVTKIVSQNRNFENVLGLARVLCKRKNKNLKT